MICWSIKTFCFPRLGFQKLHVSLGYNIFGTISSFASTPHPLYFMTAQFSPIQFFVTAPLHKPTKFYAQNALCTLMNDSDVIFAADFKNSTSFFAITSHFLSISDFNFLYFDKLDHYIQDFFQILVPLSTTFGCSSTQI